MKTSARVDFIFITEMIDGLSSWLDSWERFAFSRVAGAVSICSGIYVLGWEGGREVGFFLGHFMHSFIYSFIQQSYPPIY